MNACQKAMDPPDPSPACELRTDRSTLRNTFHRAERGWQWLPGSLSPAMINTHGSAPLKRPRPISSIRSTIENLAALGCRNYCDLGPGMRAIAIGLRERGFAVIGASRDHTSINPYNS